LSVSDRIRVDYEVFLDSVERVELERAVESYGGDFLAGLSTPSGADFEQWADRERYRLRLVLRRCVEVLIRKRLSHARLRPAIDLARWACRIDPSSIGLRHLLVEALLSAGDVVTAKLEAEELEEEMRAEGRPIDPVALNAIALARSATIEEDPRAGPGLSCEIVGRDQQFSRIVDAWKTAQLGLSTHVHVAADAGYGKTRLLRDLHRRLLASGARSVYLRANSGEHGIPSALVGDLAGRLGTFPGAAGVSPAAAGTLISLNPALSSRYNAPPDTSQGDEAIRRRSLALAEVLSAIAEETPLAVLIDDLHWCDATSRLILEAAVAKGSRDRLLVVTAATRGALGTISLPETIALRLDPIEPKDVETLVSSLAELPEQPWVSSFLDQLWRTTLGSPLLVVETLQLVMDRGCLVEREGSWECPNEGWLRRELMRGGALRRRIAELEPSQRWILTLLSAAGCPVPATHIARAAGDGRPTVLADLAVLERRALAHRTGAAWIPAHDEIAALTVDCAGSELVESAHRGLGAAIAQGETSDPNQLLRAGRHLVAGGDVSRVRGVYRRWVGLTGGTDRPDVHKLPLAFLGEGAPANAIDALAEVTEHFAEAPVPKRVPVGPAAAASLLLAGGILGFSTARLIGAPPKNPDPVAPSQAADSLVSKPQPDSATSVRWITAAGPAPIRHETDRK
jgi:hypothetical protein